MPVLRISFQVFNPPTVAALLLMIAMAYVTDKQRGALHGELPI